jgi:hypothetical protein
MWRIRIHAHIHAPNSEAATLKPEHLDAHDVTLLVDIDQYPWGNLLGAHGTAVRSQADVGGVGLR